MPKEKQQEPKEKDFDKIRVPNHTKYYATNAFIGHSTQDIRIDFCNEKFSDEKNKKFAYVVDTTVILSPKGAKKLLLALKNCVEEFEKKHNSINLGDEEKPIDYHQ